MKELSIFLDTAPIIYYLQENDEYFEIIKKYFIENINSNFFTSTITITEYLTYPYKEKNNELISKFYDFLFNMEIQVIDIDAIIAETAAHIRSEFPYFKTMDSIQLAASVISNCDYFLTNDKQLKQYSRIKTILISDLI